VNKDPIILDEFERALSYDSLERAQRSSAVFEAGGGGRSIEIAPSPSPPLENITYRSKRSNQGKFQKTKFQDEEYDNKGRRIEPQDEPHPFICSTPRFLAKFIFGSPEIPTLFRLEGSNGAGNGKH
jgi:hypothetical protein